MEPWWQLWKSLITPCDEFTSRLRMIIRKRRPLVLLRRILAQLLHQNRDSFFKLWIVTLANGLRILLHLDIGRDADVFNFPRSARIVEANRGRCDETAIHQRWITTQPAHQAAFRDWETPRALGSRDDEPSS